MAKSKEFGSVKRFGPRYGRTSRSIVGKIEHSQRKLHTCPYCRQVKAKRVSAGIWQCKNCGAKFTGKAYTLSEKKTAIVKKEAVEEVIDESLILEAEKTEKKEKGMKYKESQTQQVEEQFEEEKQPEEEPAEEEQSETLEEETIEETEEPAEEKPKKEEQ